MDKYLLETKNLTKEFGKFKAVNDVNLHIKREQFTVLSGETEQEKQHF